MVTPRLWHPPTPEGGRVSENLDQIDVLIEEGRRQLQAFIDSGDDHFIKSARDVLIEALHHLDRRDARFPWVLTNLSLVFERWYHATTRIDLINLAVEYAEAAVDAQSEGTGQHARVLVNAARARWSRYTESQDAIDLVVARDYVERIPAIDPDDNQAIFVLGNVYISSYDNSADPVDLDRAVAATEELIGAGRSAAVGFRELFVIADIHSRAYDRLRRLPELVEAIRFTQRALIFAKNAGHQAAGLSKLANLRRRLYLHTGDLSQLPKSIVAATQAVQANTPNRVYADSASVALALGLRARFEAIGRLDDVNEVIRLLRSVGPKTQKHGADFELSNALRLRYEAIGSLPDLVEALRLAERSTNEQSKNVLFLTNYSQLLQLSYIRRRDESDLMKAIEVARRAVALQTNQIEIAAMAYNALTAGLTIRYQHTQERVLIDEAIANISSALELTPSTSPIRTTYLTNKAYAVLLRSKLDEQPGDLDTAYATAVEARSMTEEDHPDRAGRLHHLASIAWERWRKSNDSKARAEALTSWEEGMASLAAPADSRVRLAIAAAMALAEDKDSARANGFLGLAVSLMPQVAWQGLDRASQESQLLKWNDLPTLAAAHALENNNTAGAIMRLEVGRSVIWHHTLRLTVDMLQEDTSIFKMRSELRRAMHAERLFREWMQSESAEQMSEREFRALAAELEQFLEPGAAAVVLGSLGLRLRQSGDLSKAIETYQNAISLAEVAEDGVNLGMLHANLGFAYRKAGDYVRGLEHYRISVDLLTHHAPPEVVGYARNNLGLGLWHQKHYDEAAVELAAAAAAFSGSQPEKEGVALSDLAAVLSHLGRIEESLSVLERARRLFLSLEDSHGQALTWYNEGVALARAERTESAIDALRQSRRLYGADAAEVAQVDAALRWLEDGE